mmetsp:Transcript_12157/g.20034  ORF Transcript_12157/g.20034 Transcript_12157/m.20034 type:complete len:146 (-) Transcript_12157:863-1300(-)
MLAALKETQPTAIFLIRIIGVDGNDPSHPSSSYLPPTLQQSWFSNECLNYTEERAISKTPGTLRSRPTSEKMRLRVALTSPRQQQPMKSPMMPGRLPMIGNAIAKPTSMFAWNHATCAIPQITPETKEGMMSCRGMWLFFPLTVM